MRVTVSPAANISNLITFPDLLSRRVDRSGFGNRPHSSQYPEPTRPAGVRDAWHTDDRLPARGAARVWAEAFDTLARNNQGLRYFHRAR